MGLIQKQEQECLISKGISLASISEYRNKVYRCILGNANQYVFMKQMEKTSNEYKIASILHSKNSPQNHTVPFVHIVSSEQFESAFLIMPIFWILTDFPIDSLAKWMDASKQILEGLAFMHSNKIAHMDLTPWNILVDVDLNDDLEEISPRRYHFIDFGLSRVLPSIDTTILNKWGTEDFLAPEVSDKFPYNPFKADVWAAGEIIKNLGMPGFSGGKEFHSLKLENLIRIMQASPEERCTAQEALNVLETSESLSIPFSVFPPQVTNFQK